MGPAGVRLEVEGTLEAVSRAVADLRGHLDARIAPDAPLDCAAIELGVAEVLTNIVLHGHGGGPIELECLRREAEVEILVRDTGQPIPPERLARAGPACFAFDPGDLKRLPDHGMGLALVKALFHSLDYGHADGRNEMRLRRRLDVVAPDRGR